MFSDINLVILFLTYDTEKYCNAFNDLQRYLKKVDCNKQIIIIDNKIVKEYLEKIDENIIKINGDNSAWEFSGWDRGLKYIKDNNIKYDAVLFVNDSFMNDGNGGTPDTIINNMQLYRCIDNNVPIQAVINEGRPDAFKINNKSTDIRGRSHCFMLSKAMINRLGEITTLDEEFINKCINKEVSKPYFRLDAPINDNLKYFIEGWLGGYWHSAFKFEDNWYLFRMKTLAFLNELMLASRIKDLETDYEYQIDNSELIIFDVFDTAIFRKFSKPYKVHYHMGCSFLGNRQKAEQKALELNINCNLEDIYKAGNLPIEKLEQEITLELASCYQNPEIFKYYQYAISKGKEVIFLSDMYLSSIQIQEMLIKCGYKDPKVFVSNEINVRKDNGQAYIFIKSLYKDPSKMLMIGDNEHSDYKMAKSIGLKAIRYAKKEDEKDFWYKLGYNRIGSIAYAYVNWLKEQFKEKGIKKAYFFSREGDLFYKIYNEIKSESDPEGVLLHVSRKALNIPLLADISQEEFFNNPEYHYLRWHLTFTITVNTTEEYCNYFGVDYGKFVNILHSKGLTHLNLTQYSFVEREKIQTEILKVIYDEVKSKAVLAKHSAFAYLSDKVGIRDKKIAIVDLGWGGSIQESFIKIINSPYFSPQMQVECFLLAPETRIKDRQDKYSFNCFLELNNPTFTKNVYLMECLFNAPYGSCLGYTDKANPIFDNEDCGYCEYIHEGVLDFIKDSRYMTIGSYQKLGLFNLNNLLNSPEIEEAKHIGGLKLYSSGTVGFAENIASLDFSFIEEQRKKARNKPMFDLNVRRMFQEWEAK